MNSLVKRGLIWMLCFAVSACGTKLFAQDGGPLKVIQPADQGAEVAGSPGILAGDMLYISGQNGRNAAGSVPTDFKQEVSQSMHGVQSVLRAAGMDYGNIVWLTVFVTNAANIDPMNDVYWKTIGSSPPARTVLRVAALPNGENVEINCIAAKDTSTRRAVWPAGWHHGPHIDPPAIAAKDVYYLSAQGGYNPLTGKIPDDYGAEVKQALDNVAIILKTANMSMANVVWVNPYVGERDQEAPPAAGAPIAHNGQPQSGGANSMNSIYATYFEFGNTPGRGTITVAGLPDKMNIVFSCIAGSDITKRKSIQTFNMKPSPTASPGVVYRDTFYMSGKSGFIPDQGVVTQDVELQLRQTMRNLLDDLQAANMDFPDSVFSTIYMQKIQDADKVQILYKTFFKKDLPARTTLQQSFDMKTTTGEQITLIAVRQPKQ